MINVEDIRIVHVEASSRCNSHCPMCSRYTGLGHIQPGLEEGDLDLDIFYKMFTTGFTNQLEHVYFSGVYGDPCLNKNLPTMVKYLIKNGCKSISIDTNGGYRDEEWWANLAAPRTEINFALDGASNDSLGKYRINVQYDKVIRNMTAYINAGGQAQWNFIVFKHNEHEVETARELAKQLGAKFRIKVTQKFRGKKDYAVMVNGQEIGRLEPPIQQEYRHSNVGIYPHKPSSQFQFDLNNYQHLSTNNIDCKSLKRQEVFLAANGLLLPCCYLGTYTHDSPGAFQFTRQFRLEKFNLVKNSVEEILNNMNDIKSRWTRTVEKGNLVTCLHTCGSQENTTLYYNDKLKKENILKIS